MSQAMLSIPVVVLPHGKGLELPEHKTAGSAGLDLRAALPESEPLTLNSLERVAVPTGLRIAIPDGFEGQVRPRSGSAFRLGLTVVNAPGTIDSDYRGELKVLLINLGSEVIELSRGQRIAQLVIAPIQRSRLIKVDVLDDTERGGGGFGSTGQG